MSDRIRIVTLRAKAERSIEVERTLGYGPSPAIAAEVLLALVAEVEATHLELTAIEAWAAEQNAGNAFAEQVRYWALSQHDKLLARFDFEAEA